MWDVEPQVNRDVLRAEAALKMAPTLAEVQVVGQVCGLRPGSADHLPLIGAVPGWPGVYMVAGHFRSGMLLSTISTRCIADLISTGKSPVSLAAFAPARFTPTPHELIANLTQELEQHAR